MTVAYHHGEDWLVTDGAPEGVRFDTTIPSLSEPGKSYRIVRQESSYSGPDGYIIHTPACRAWRAGNHMCGHVLRALETAEDPLRRLALDAVEAWNFKGISLEDFRTYAAAIYQSAQQAIAQADDNDRYEERLQENARLARRSMAEVAADLEQAIVEFGGLRTVAGGR